MVEFLSIKQNGYFYLSKILDNSVCMIAKYYDKIQHSKERMNMIRLRKDGHTDPNYRKALL